mmetsp:Transcript_39378/g.94094  ORF Transcript_39378/g.94094 Transcript_39378/m.94094 type:complete len:223 (+) Transcript_39378:889-1557(+)
MRDMIDRYLVSRKIKSICSMDSESVVKSRISENMIVTSLGATCSLEARQSPLMMFLTTGSGTKRAKVSMPRERRQNASCTSLMSRILELASACSRLPGPWNSKFPSSRSWLLRSFRGLATAVPRPHPMPTVNTVVTRKAKAALWRMVTPILCMASSMTWNSSSAAVSTERASAWKAGEGETRTTSHRSSSSSLMEAVPTSIHPGAVNSRKSEIQSFDSFSAR